MAQQPHTEETIRHTDDEQDTGNHKLPNTPDTGGADRFGGSRAGAENVEHASGQPGGTESIERSGHSAQDAESVERLPGEDEEGRLQDR